MAKRSFVLGCVLALLSAGCGGGGGGGDFVGAGLVAVTASPTRIDTGDRMMVRTEITDVNSNGIALKFRIPAQFSYVLDSSFLTAAGETLDVSPAVNLYTDDTFFLVYYFSQGDFGRSVNGILEFELRANAKLDEGEIEVDADVDDPLVDNVEEFDPENPEFGAEDSVFVKITE